MASHTPTSTFFPLGVVIIESEDSTDYNTIQEALSSSENYLINKIYLKSNDISQILQPITFRKYDSNGNIDEDKTIPTVDPFSFQPSLDIDFVGKEHILDGTVEIIYNIKPSEVVYFYLDTTVIDNVNLLGNQKGFDEEFLRTYGFFQDYEDEIIIDFNYEQSGVPKRTNQEPTDKFSRNR